MKRKIANLLVFTAAMIPVLFLAWIIFNGGINIIYEYHGDTCGNEEQCIRSIPTAPAYVHWGDICQSCVPSPPMIRLFANINGIILLIFPLISILSIVFICGTKAYSYIVGVVSLRSVVENAAITVAYVTAMFMLTGPAMWLLSDLSQTVVDGQYQANRFYGNAVHFVAGIVPILYLVALSSLVSIHSMAVELGHGSPIAMMKYEWIIFRTKEDPLKPQKKLVYVRIRV